MDLYEKWKTTQYKNYEVSNKGRVRNKTTKVILKPYAHIVEVCQGKLNKTAGYGWSYL